MRVLARGALVAAVVAGAWLAANLIDDSPDPAVAAYFDSGPLDSRGGDGFALIAGFAAPVDRDPREHGRTRISRPRGTPAEPPPLDIRGSHLLMCAPEKEDCPELMSANPLWVEELALDNAVLLARYRDLQKAAALGEWGAFRDINIAGFDHASVVMATQRVFLSQVSLEARNDRLTRALVLLEEDAAFQRRWLAESRTLLGKMLATRGMTRDLLVAAQLVRHADQVSPAQAGILRRICAPPTAGELSFARTWRAEAAHLRYLLGTFRGNRESAFEFHGERSFSVDAGRLLILPNATLNQAYPLFVRWEALDGVPSPRVAAESARIRAELQARIAPGASWFRNTFGRRFVADSFSNLGEYVLRVHDVGALARLVQAQVELRAAGPSADAVPAFLEASDPAWRDPFTGLPMRWDRSTAELWFSPASERLREDRIGGRRDRVAIAPWKTPPTSTSPPAR